MLLYLALIDTEDEKRKFVFLYEKYRQTMYYAAEQILHQPHAAEDAVHQAFLRLIDHLDQVDEKDAQKTKGFLVVITQHIAIDMYRKRKREYTAVYDEKTESEVTAQAADEAENAVIQAILELPPDDSVVLRLKYVYGYRGKEIARLLNISEDAVRQRISRAKKRLAKRLADEEVM